MKTIDLTSPLPDRREVLANRLSLWHSYRQERLASAEQYPSQVWLAEAINGLTLAMESGDVELTSECLAEVLSLGCAHVVAQSMASDSLRIGLPESVTFECRFVPATSAQWLAVVMSAIISEDRPRMSLLSQQDFSFESEGFVSALGRAFLALALQQPDLDELIRQVSLYCETESDQHMYEALLGLRQDRLVELKDFSGLESLTLSTLARSFHAGEEHQHATSSIPPAIEITCLLPVRAALHDREPNWFFNLHGYPSYGRHHQLSQEQDGGLMACYQIDADAELPAVEACFLLIEAGQQVRYPLALDAGELMFLSDWYAQQVDAEPPENVEALRKQRILLDESLQMLEAVLMRVGKDEEGIAESSVVSELGMEHFNSEPERFSRARLQQVRDSYKELLETIDQRLATGAGSGEEREDTARGMAMQAIELLKAEVKPILLALAQDRSGEVLQQLLPREDDFSKVFYGPAIELAREAYKGMDSNSLMYPSREQEKLLCFMAPAGMLMDENELSRHFPAGYKAIAHLLNPHRVWVRWKFVRPGETTGMAYDGLVWVDDHWAWFPKPFRVLQTLVENDG